MMADNKTITVYCAGPSYAPEERRHQQEIAAVLERSGYTTYLPYRDGLEHIVYKIMAGGETRWPVSRLREAAFALELYQVIERCGALVFNMNGRVPDEGGLFCSSLAFATGKPLIIYKNDHRSIFYGEDNSMVTGLSYNFTKVKSVSKIPGALDRAVRVFKALGANHYSPVAMNNKQCNQLCKGREIWQFVNNKALVACREKMLSEVLKII